METEQAVIGTVFMQQFEVFPLTSPHTVKKKKKKKEKASPIVIRSAAP